MGGFSLVQVTVSHYDKEFQVCLVTTSRLDASLKLMN
jgi:hypothetical protein